MSDLEPAKLYYIQGSPFARLCRLLIDEWHLPVQSVILEHPLPDDYFEITPTGQVPVLKTVGETIFPTSQIVEQLWAMTQEASAPYLDPLADRQILAVILEIGNFLVTAQQQVWAGLEPVGKNELGYNPRDRHILRAQKTLDWLEAQAGEWLIRNEINVCDYALACIILWAESRMGIQWRDRKKLAAIVDKLQERPSFKRIALEPYSAA